MERNESTAKKAHGDIFKTSDIYISAAISVLLNTQPEYQVEKGLTMFIFPFSESLREAISAFYSGMEINAYVFSQTIKRLRTEMFQAKANMR
jgi:hypothetical protein